MKSADQKARKKQNYFQITISFNAPLLKATFLLPELIWLTSQFFEPPGRWGGRQREAIVHAFQNTTSKKNVGSHFVNFALKVCKRKNLVLTKLNTAYLIILNLK